MTTDRLREPQVPEPKKNQEVFKTEFLDNSDKMIPIEIEYAWRPYWGLACEKVIDDFDWDCGEANISRKELLEEVKELIRERENPTHITFY